MGLPRDRAESRIQHFGDTITTNSGKGNEAEEVQQEKLRSDGEPKQCSMEPWQQVEEVHRGGVVGTISCFREIKKMTKNT